MTNVLLHSAGSAAPPTAIDIVLRRRQTPRARRRPHAVVLSAWLLQLLVLVSRPRELRAADDNGASSRSYFRRGSENNGGGTTSTTSSGSYSEGVMASDLPQQAISGTCIASEPQRDCGLHTWSDLSCPQILSSYAFDPQSTCCSFQDSADGGLGCVLTVGGAGNSCTWREPGDTHRYFTVTIMDRSTSVCPLTQYAIPPTTTTTTKTEQPQQPSPPAPSPVVTPSLASEVPSVVPSNASPPQASGSGSGSDIPLAPIPSPAAAAPARAPSLSPTTLPSYSAEGGTSEDGDDDSLAIPEAPIPSPADPGATARTRRPTLQSSSSSSSPTVSYREEGQAQEPPQQEMTTGLSSGSCWATEPTLECGLLRLPSVSCTDLLQAYEWSGTCCSFQDTEDGEGCSLTVDGPKSHCTWRQKSDDGHGNNGDVDEYTMYISGLSTAVCPPSRYTVPVGDKVDGYDGPTPAPERSTGSCWTTSPNEECGYYTWSDPCSEVAEAYMWEGGCCSLSDTDSGGCRLTVDGPGARCAFVDAASEYTIFVSQDADGACPPSSYDVGAKDTDVVYDSPTPEPVTSGYCSTTNPDESCGIYAFSESCESLRSQHDWSGTCCSLERTETGGCRLVVDGPGSTCTWKEKGKESYFSVEIDDRNDRSCPESAVANLSGAGTMSEFAQCVSQAFADCLTTCKRYPTLRQSFKACARTDSTEATQCAAGAASLCLNAKGRAPAFLCQQVANMVASGALHTEQCLALQGKCAAGQATNACT